MIARTIISAVLISVLTGCAHARPDPPADRQKLNELKSLISIGQGIDPTDVCEIAFDFVAEGWTSTQYAVAAIQPLCGRVIDKQYFQSASRVRCAVRMSVDAVEISDLEGQLLDAVSETGVLYEGWSAERGYCERKPGRRITSP